MADTITIKPDEAARGVCPECGITLIKCPQTQMDRDSGHLVFRHPKQALDIMSICPNSGKTLST